MLTPEDGLGDGFIMQWLDGETLGARIVRDPSFDAIRPRLAEQCGEILARIHAIDLKATGLEARLNRVTPEQYVRQTWERYQALGTPQPMIDFTGALAAGAPAAELRADAGPQRLSQRQHHGVGGTASSPCSTGRSPTSAIRCAISAGSAPTRGGSAAANCRSAVSVTIAICSAATSACPVRTVDPAHVKFWEIFGSFWWAVRASRMAEHYRTGPDKTVERPGHRPAVVRMSGRLREPVDPGTGRALHSRSVRPPASTCRASTSWSSACATICATT